MAGFLHTGKFTGVLARLTQGAGKGGIIPCRKVYGGLKEGFQRCRVASKNRYLPQFYVKVKLRFGGHALKMCANFYSMLLE